MHNNFKLSQALLAAMATAPQASAEMPANIQNHKVQKQFMVEKCAVAVAAIDDPAGGLIGVGEMAMTFGFIMGFEATAPGIKGSYETILMRLRDECLKHPDQTAWALLNKFAAE